MSVHQYVRSFNGEYWPRLSQLYFLINADNPMCILSFVSLG